MAPPAVEDITVRTANAQRMPGIGCPLIGFVFMNGTNNHRTRVEP
jgi:hypothetical protein